VATRVLGAAVLTGVLLSGCGAVAQVAAPTQRQWHPSFHSQVLAGSVTSSIPSHLYVGYAVSNVGRARGAATCAVVVAGSVRGRFRTRELNAGSTWYQVKLVTIPAELGEQVLHSRTVSWGMPPGPSIAVQCD
jgi:hypothetical protein